MTNEVRIVLPATEESLVAGLMRELTKQIATSGHEVQSEGFLGGDYGYGAYFKNSVFQMLPFYWGDCDDTCDYYQVLDDWDFLNPHKPDCYQTFLNSIHYEDTNTMQEKEGHSFRDNCTKIACEKYGFNPDNSGALVHCTCGITGQYLNFIEKAVHNQACLMDKPNFIHLPTGTTVSWYKYIGRDMEYDKNLSYDKWQEIMADCLTSLKQSPKTGQAE